MSTSTPPATAWPFQKMVEDFASKFVYLPTTNWQRAFSPQINFGCNLQDQDTEQHVLDNVGSYGYQLGRIIDVLNALVARLPAAELTPQERLDVADFQDMAHRVEAALEEKQGPAKLVLRKQVRHGDLTDHLPLDDQLHRLRLSQNPRSWILAPSRVGVNLEPAPRDVDDPVHGDAATAVDPSQRSVLGHAGARDLDHQGDVLGVRVAGRVILDSAAHDGHVRLGLASPVGDPHRIFLANVPACW